MKPIEKIRTIFKNNSERIFLIDSMTGEKLTYGQLHNEACAIGEYLLSKGLNKSDRVLILLNNSIALAKLYFGCLYAGIVVVPVNPILSESEVSYIVNSSQVKLIITSLETRQKIDLSSLINQNIEILNLVSKTEPDENADDNTVLNISNLTKNERFIPFDGISGQDDLALIYSSGTTSKP